MAESCQVNVTVSRNSLAEVLRRLAAIGQKPVGEALGKSETWVSRFKSEDAQTFADLLSTLGLKVVPAENKCYPPAHIEHLQYFAQLGMQQQAPTLDWDNE